MNSFEEKLKGIIEKSTTRKLVLSELGENYRGKIDRALKMLKSNKKISVCHRQSRLNEQETENLMKMLDSLISLGYYPSLPDIQQLVFLIKNKNILIK
jgi:hypothetical protein